MLVSHNELVAAVNKAFLGMRRSCGEADVIANMVADLQMVGLHGVRHFNNASRYISHDQDCPADITLAQPQLISVDLHRCSLACHLPVIMDYAIEKMVGSKSMTIELNHCHNRWLAYSELVKLAAKGIACMARWTNGSSPKHTMYILNRGCVAPELFLSDALEAPESDSNSMVIELSTQDFNVKALSRGYSVHIDSNELSQAQQDAWHNGINVDSQEWGQLKQTATAILVENSEQSVKGAGEVA
ncbi:DUF3726 domain-containing protein [Vibrio cionasavignyae]|uniref:DUF3726 domain-containing protein n=1 Tax=Vibrio cionasavignyae TaxID=2910252 RepID=UPI003D120687